MAEKGMRSQLCNIEVQCSGCGSMFEMHYDLALLERVLPIGVFIHELQARLATRQLLCKDCME